MGSYLDDLHACVLRAISEDPVQKQSTNTTGKYTRAQCVPFQTPGPEMGSYLDDLHTRVWRAISEDPVQKQPTKSPEINSGHSVLNMECLCPKMGSYLDDFHTRVWRAIREDPEKQRQQLGVLHVWGHHHPRALHHLRSPTTC
jgi:hypothetical protein